MIAKIKNAIQRLLSIIINEAKSAIAIPRLLWSEAQWARTVPYYGGPGPQPIVYPASHKDRWPFRRAADAAVSKISTVTPIASKKAPKP